jgi:hypothetical protein
MSKVSDDCKCLLPPSIIHIIEQSQAIPSSPLPSHLVACELQSFTPCGMRAPKLHNVTDEGVQLFPTYTMQSLAMCLFLEGKHDDHNAFVDS